MSGPRTTEPGKASGSEPAPAIEVRANMLTAGDIVWVRMENAVGSEIEKTRPWLVTSGPRFNKKFGLFAAVPLSSQDNIGFHPAHRFTVKSDWVEYVDGKLPTELRLDRIDRTALCEHARTVAEARIIPKAGVIVVAKLKGGQDRRRLLDNVEAGIRDVFNDDPY